MTRAPALTRLGHLKPKDQNVNPVEVDQGPEIEEEEAEAEVGEQDEENPGDEGFRH